MGDISLDEGRVKELFKQAVLEVLEKRRDLIYDVLAEVMEDFALARAIQEGKYTKSALHPGSCLPYYPQMPQEGIPHIHASERAVSYCPIFA